MDSRLYQSSFHKKIPKKTVLVIIFALLFTSPLFCESKRISTLCLDFVRTDTIENVESPYSTSMKGQIVYSANPFFFAFITERPQKQSVFIDDKSMYYIENDTVNELEEGRESLEQICRDFLNWFKDDFGLEESLFKPTEHNLEKDMILTYWDYNGQETHPIDRVLVYTDKAGKVTKLTMLQNFNTPTTQTSLYDYKYFTGKNFPTRIVSSSYEDGKVVLTTELCFSNIIFNQPQKMFSMTKVSLTDVNKETDLSKLPAVQSVHSPESTSYDVSIPQVLLKSSFKFYKKYITEQDMSNCPFYPSCSQYIVDAVKQNGIFGFVQGLERLKRCTNTEHSRGLYPTLANGKHYDPVPPKKGDSK